MGNVARGLVPRARGAGYQSRTRATEDKTRQPVPRFSYLGVPAPDVMCNWYENGQPLRIQR